MRKQLSCYLNLTPVKINLTDIKVVYASIADKQVCLTTAKSVAGKFRHWIKQLNSSLGVVTSIIDRNDQNYKLEYYYGQSAYMPSVGNAFGESWVVDNSDNSVVYTQRDIDPSDSALFGMLELTETYKLGPERDSINRNDSEDRDLLRSRDTEAADGLRILSRQERFPKLWSTYTDDASFTSAHKPNTQGNISGERSLASPYFLTADTIDTLYDIASGEFYSQVYSFIEPTRFGAPYEGVTLAYCAGLRGDFSDKNKVDYKDSMSDDMLLARTELNHDYNYYTDSKWIVHQPKKIVSERMQESAIHPTPAITTEFYYELTDKPWALSSMRVGNGIFT